MKSRHCPFCDDQHNRAEAVIQMWGALWLCRECALKVDHVGRRKVAIYDLHGDFSAANLRKLAEAGIMDANALFLPAGKLRLAETEARERALVERL